jgi:hypothetical protein
MRRRLLWLLPLLLLLLPLPLPLLLPLLLPPTTVQTLLWPRSSRIYRASRKHSGRQSTPWLNKSSVARTKTGSPGLPPSLLPRLPRPGQPAAAIRTGGVDSY